jgi:hypothetical protein
MPDIVTRRLSNERQGRGRREEGGKEVQRRKR